MIELIQKNNSKKALQAPNPNQKVVKEENVQIPKIDRATREQAEIMTFNNEKKKEMHPEVRELKEQTDKKEAEDYEMRKSIETGKTLELKKKQQEMERVTIEEEKREREEKERQEQLGKVSTPHIRSGYKTKERS